VLIEEGIAGAGLSPETKYFAPALKEINAEKILPLPIEEVQANFRKYLEEYRTYFGK